ncbi:thioredoxin domain-containing protein [Terriglobus roseus]|uniref:Protein-disulfide isomerase n=1 Tax=Terriglobus roseus TaxID=392734 RepID=A0A1G7HML1_9BACT|nr:thioredoxin domain-containing protein [Terriglobus roseus]SDF01648.1 Protein-disulfide isomerase [Terriglobus roseus]
MSWKMVQLLLSAVMILLGAAMPVYASDCVAPTKAELDAAQAYFINRQIVPVTVTIATEALEPNDECFWKIRFYSRSSSQSATWFLSPDHRYLLPALYDLSSKPTLQTWKKNARLMDLLSSGNPPMVGSATAPVEIVMFSDFECPYCRQLEKTMKEEILPRYGNKIRIVFRQFPLQTHSWAHEAALVTSCIARDDVPTFWQVKEFIFSNQESITESNLVPLIAPLLKQRPNLEPEALVRCSRSQETQRLVDRDMELGTQNGVYSTPTLFINGVLMRGTGEIQRLNPLIEAMIAQTSNAATQGSNPH